MSPPNTSVTIIRIGLSSGTTTPSGSNRRTGAGTTIQTDNKKSAMAAARTLFIVGEILPH